MGEFESLFNVFDSLDVGFVEAVLSRSYRPEGSVGRPHRNLLGMFKAELVKRLRSIEGYHELHRLLEADDALRSLCIIEEGEKPYDPSTLARFRQRVGPEKLQHIMTRLVEQLSRMGVIDGETVVLDAAFIKAYSRRDPHDTQRGFSDFEARLRKQGRNVVLGYGVHLAVDTTSEMPLGVTVEPANVNARA